MRKSISRRLDTKLKPVFRILIASLYQLRRLAKNTSKILYTRVLDRDRKSPHGITLIVDRSTYYFNLSSIKRSFRSQYILWEMIILMYFNQTYI